VPLVKICCIASVAEAQLAIDAGVSPLGLVSAPPVDALLLDSGNPALAVKQLGGTGRMHDWALSRRIRDSDPVPVWLAGGLGAHNVAAA